MIIIIIIIRAISAVVTRTSEKIEKNDKKEVFSNAINNSLLITEKSVINILLIASLLIFGGNFYNALF